MKRFHPLSFGLGLASGLVVLVLVVGGMRMLGGGARRGGFGAGGPNIQRMAERFGMTEAELRAEMDSGKTMQQIAEEHGVQFNPSAGLRTSSGFGGRGQGGSTSSTMSSASSMSAVSGSSVSSAQ